MNFGVFILGNSSATPSYQRHPSAQVINFNERLFLIDCGEGTQIQFNRYKIKYHRINHIFISHLHGDHYLGLMGLLFTLHLQGRTNDLHIYSHRELKEIIDLQLKVSDTGLRYKLVYHSLHSHDEIIYEDDNIIVETIALNHRIPCCGFLFKEKEKPRNLIKEKIEQYNIPLSAYASLKEGQDYLKKETGEIIKNEELTILPRKTRTYAYCSDTLYNEEIIPKIQGVNLLYHEATFLHEMINRANETFHTTSLQAAQLAKKAQVKKLLIGHFSARYKDLNDILIEAQSIFPNTLLAIEGEYFLIP